MSLRTIILIAVIALIGWGIALYNKFIRLRNQVDEAWSDIDVQLKRRYDLIPNLVNTVKGYASHEKEVFAKVTEMRSMAMQAGDPHAKAQAEGMLTGALKSLFAVSEAYPDLKANTNFLELQRELSDTENKVQASRRFYNGMVRDFNTMVEMFPSSIIASVFSFNKREFFDLDETPEQREVVNVDFDSSDEAHN